MPAWIDVHSHIYPRPYREMLKSRSQPPRVVEEDGVEYLLLFEEQKDLPPTAGVKLSASFTDLDEKIRFMDSLGIAKTIVSVGNPWLDPFSAGNSHDLARTINEELSSYERATDGRIGGMGVLPAADTGLVVQTAHEIADDAHLYGVITGSRIAGHELDDPALEELWAAAASRKLAILVHPHYSAARSELGGYGHALPVALGNPFETTIAVTRLILGGVLHRHPTLRVIASHGGGALPYLASRLDASWRSSPALHARLPHPPSEDVRKLFVDTILFHERSMNAAADLVSTAHMVFGTDHPFAVADPPANIAALSAAFGSDDLEQIGSRSALVALGIDG